MIAPVVCSHREGNLIHWSNSFIRTIRILFTFIILVKIIFVVPSTSEELLNESTDPRVAVETLY